MGTTWETGCKPPSGAAPLLRLRPGHRKQCVCSRIFSATKSLHLHVCQGTQNCALVVSWHCIVTRALWAPLLRAPVSERRRCEQWCWREPWCVLLAGLTCYLHCLGCHGTLQNAAALQDRQCLFVVMHCVSLNSRLKASPCLGVKL